jgi:hypothetical protein
MNRRFFLSFLGFVLGGPAAAFDGVAADGLLPDDDFFALATCGAPRGGMCQGPTVRWAKRRVTLALIPSDAALSSELADLLDRSIDDAVIQINRVRSALRLRRTDRPDADIRIQVTASQPGDEMLAVEGISAPGIMGVGYSTIWWNGRQEIVEAVILISTAMEVHDMRSVVLEEIFQSLGPRFDVEGMAYEGVSILSQDSNATVTIEGQDARLLHWLYPRPAL